MKTHNYKASHVIRHTPFFFLINDSFVTRTGLKPTPEMYVATDIAFHGPVLEMDPDGKPLQVDASYLVKLLNIPDPLLINSTEMHPINSHVPDGMCRHRIDPGSYLAAEQILYMVEYPVHPN